MIKYDSRINYKGCARVGSDGILYNGDDLVRSVILLLPNLTYHQVIAVQNNYLYLPGCLRYGNYNAAALIVVENKLVCEVSFSPKSV